MKKLLLLIIGIGFSYTTMFGQNVAINSTGAAPNASSMLDISSANSGLLIPRLALSATNNASPVTSPATSLMIYNTATAGAGSTAVTPGYYYWNGSIWVRVLDATAGDDWHISGNSGTTVGTHFLGTTDNVSFAIKTNNTERIRVLNTGNVGIGTTTPSQLFHVAGNSLVTVNSYIGSATNGELHYGASGLFGQATAFVPNGGTSGLWIEGSNDGESGGMFMNGNTFCIWSPGDSDILRVYDEDNFAGGPKIVLDGSGDFGIGLGTGSPNYKLELEGSFGFGNISGIYRSRTETRNDAGLQGNAGAQSGFFETSAPSPATDWPSGASSWWHLIDCRHSNSTNNYALQIAGSFFDQRLFFRKTNGSSTTAWNELVTMAQLQYNTYGTNNQGVTGTTNCSINSTTFTDMPQMSITFTPVHSTVYVNFTMAGYESVSSWAQQYVDFRILRNGVVVGGANCTAGDADYADLVTSFNGALNLAVPVTPGVSTTIKVQWRRDGIYTNTIYCNVASYPDFNHRSLIIID